MNTIIDNIDPKQYHLTAKEVEVLEILKNDPYAFRSSTATEIATKYNISQSAISRFCQKLGYSGFSDFRLSLIFNSPINDNTTIDNAYYANLFNNICNNLSSSISNETLDEISNIMLKARNCYFSGYGASNISALFLSFQCMVQGMRAYHLSTSTEVETLHIMNNEDVVILFSAINSSHKDFFSMLEDLPPTKRPYIILIANTPRHPFAKKVDKMILLPNSKDIDPSIIFTPSILQMVFSFFLITKLSLAKANMQKANQ